MSRLIIMDEKSFNHINSDSSVSNKFIFEKTKAEKTGEVVHDKNCLAKQFKPSMCFLLSLACWICLCAEKLEKTVFLFVNPGAKLGTAAQRYCTQLSELVQRNFEVAKHFLRLSHFNAHGIRKGSGLHASSASTMPSTFVAVAARGEGSIGKILDVYFKFAMGGDQYLG